MVINMALAQTPKASWVAFTNSSDQMRTSTFGGAGSIRFTQASGNKSPMLGRRAMARSRRDLERIGREYRNRPKNIHHALPDRVRRSGKKEERKAAKLLGDGVGILSRLFTCGPGLVHIIVSLAALDLAHLEHEPNLYAHDAVGRIKAKTFELFSGPFWARLEVGREARKLHLHVLAHESPPVTHHAEPVLDLGRMAAYLAKTQTPSDDLAAGVFLVARVEAFKAGKPRLPKTSWSRGIPSGRAPCRVIEPE